MDCKNCKNHAQNIEPVQYIVHEAEMARIERIHEAEMARIEEMHKQTLGHKSHIIIGLIISLTICIILLSSSFYVCYKQHKNCVENIEAINKYWIDYISQYDFEDYSVELSTDGGGDANYIGENGDIYNGTYNSSQEDEETEGREIEWKSN